MSTLALSLFAICLTLTIYIVAGLLDVYRYRMYFRRYFLQRDRRLHIDSSDAKFYTIFGRYLSELSEDLTALKRSYDFLEPNNYESNSFKKIDRFVDQLRHCLTESEALDEECFRKVLSLLSTMFHGSAFAVVLLNEEDFESSFVCTFEKSEKKVLNSRFRNRLINYYESFFKFGDKSNIGLKDAHDIQSQNSDFAIFGFRYSISHSIAFRDNADRLVKGVLWLGYSSDQMPLIDEVQLAETLTQKISLEINTSRKLYELSNEIEKAKIVDQQRNKFFSHASHDIRAPLNNIRSILSLLSLECAGESDHKELIEVALGNCTQMAEIVDDILDFSKFQAGQLSGRKEDVDAEVCIDKVVNAYRVEAKLKNLKLTILQAQEDLVVNVDRKHLQRIISNLVSNAIKYTREGYVEISAEHVGDSDEILISVKDTGIGMSKDNLDELFTPFSRFHQKEADGVGLGLALTKILVELNNGKINVRSNLDKGTIFEIRFPRSNAQSSEVLFREEFPTKTSSSVLLEAGKKILVTDDDAGYVDSIVRNLRKMNLTIFNTYTVKDAMSILNYELPDILISDLNMPGGGGKRLLKFIKDKNYRTKVLVLTGSDGIELENELLELGATKVLSKDTPIALIQNWIESISRSENEEPSDRSGRLVA